MGKHGWLFLPKQVSASRGFACMKMFLLSLFLTCFVYEVYLTVLNIKYYRERVQDLRVSSIFPSRSEIQVESTHAHFFLFTGLMNAAAILVGVWGILMEYLIALAAYAYFHGIVIGFEVIGAYMSDDAGVATRKGAAVLPEPILVILALVFAHMIRVAEKEMASSPEYKKKMAQRAGKGETAAHADYVLSADKKDEGLTEVRVSKGWNDNPALVLDDGISSGPSSRNQSLSSVGSQDVTVLTSDGRTRIAINASPSAPEDPPSQ